MHHYRQALLRMRQGDSDRDIAEARIMGRRKAGQWRALAQAHGWLDTQAPLPDDEAVAGALQPPKRASTTVSSLQEHHAKVASWVAQNVGHCAVRQGVDVIFTTCASLTQSLNAARATGGYERKLATLARVPLLIIDDFGLKPLRSPADEDLHDLIAERYEQASTIVTSNLDFPEWDQAFPSNRLLASASLDRLRHNAYCMVLDGASYRAPRTTAGSVKSTPAKAAK